MTSSGSVLKQKHRQLSEDVAANVSVTSSVRLSIRPGRRTLLGIRSFYRKFDHASKCAEDGNAAAERSAAAAADDDDDGKALPGHLSIHQTSSLGQAVAAATEEK